jgi:hypothetical protein
MNVNLCLKENKENSVIGRQEKIKLSSNKSEAKKYYISIKKLLQDVKTPLS